MVATDLIIHYVQQNPHKRGAEDAVVRGVGVSVWILIEAYRASDGDTERVAQAWNLPREAVDAALAYYAEHTAAIDARINAQRAAFA